MDWEINPIKVAFLKRYKRFFADIRVNGRIEVAHVANTGSLKSCLVEGGAALVLPSTNPERKLKWTLVALQSPHGSWIGVDTSRPNRLLKKVAEENLCDQWRGYGDFKPEVKITPETRLDGVFQTGPKKRKLFIEVKNVTMATGDYAGGKGRARFPDAVTERGQKHLRELMRLMDEGHECELVFAVQRRDCIDFQPADDIDPEYGKLLREADKKGLRISPWVIEVDEQGVHYTGEILKVRL